MAEHAQPHSEHHGHTNYFKVYWILLGLLCVSIVGPMIGIKILTLITAFGIAVVKAYLVASNFMHLKVEKKYIAYLLLTALALLTLFFSGVAPDVMNHRGRQWENVAAQREVERALQVEHSGHGSAHH